MTYPQKHSFTKFFCEIDAPRLLSETRSIPEDAWTGSLWRREHCSVNMFLVRGGRKGVHEDFTTSEATDHGLLAEMPYLSYLVSDDGPFGRPSHAFLFNMRPGGVSRVHIDFEETWHQTHRIHIPITSNDSCRLLSDYRSIHMPVGTAWSFDNQTLHGALNGGHTNRIHLIMDVPPNPNLDTQIARATIEPGVTDLERWRRCLHDYNPEVSLPFYVASLSVKQKQEKGINPFDFASVVIGVPDSEEVLEKGDLLLSVDGIRTDPIASNVLDYIEKYTEVGQWIELTCLRDNEPFTYRTQVRKESNPIIYPENFRNLPGVRSGAAAE